MCNIPTRLGWAADPPIYIYVFIFEFVAIFVLLHYKTQLATLIKL